MARCPFAEWRPVTGSTLTFTGGPKKAVHHKTQGGTLAGAESAYRKNKSDPHFTVHEGGIAQHVDTRYAAKSLRNPDGGVQTNRDGAIQVEVVGWSGKTAGAKTLANLARLLQWLRSEEGIPWVWPMGRPPKTSEDGFGLNNGDRSASTWDAHGGHYGHSQVPENTHWDPAYTDEEWRFLNEQMGAALQPAPQPAPAPPHIATVKELDMAKIAAGVVAGTTNASGDIAFVHETGTAPTSVTAIPVGSGSHCSWQPVLQNKDGFGVVFRVHSTESGGPVVPNAPVAIAYVAVWD